MMLGGGGDRWKVSSPAPSSRRSSRSSSRRGPREAGWPLVRLPERPAIVPAGAKVEDLSTRTLRLERWPCGLFGPAEGREEQLRRFLEVGYGAVDRLTVEADAGDGAPSADQALLDPPPAVAEVRKSRPAARAHSFGARFRDDEPDPFAAHDSGESEPEDDALALFETSALADAPLEVAPPLSSRSQRFERPRTVSLAARPRETRPLATVWVRFETMGAFAAAYEALVGAHLETPYGDDVPVLATYDASGHYTERRQSQRAAARKRVVRRHRIEERRFRDKPRTPPKAVRPFGVPRGVRFESAR